MITDIRTAICHLRIRRVLTADHLGFDLASAVASTGEARLVTQDGIEIVAWRLVSTTNNDNEEI